MNTFPISRHCLLLALLALSARHEVAAQSVEEKVTEIRTRYNAIEGAKLRTKAIEFEAQDEPLSGTCSCLLYTSPSPRD